MRSRFGPEYERAVEERGGSRAAEAQLAEREKRVRHYRLTALGAEERQRFALAWRKLQAQFVDNPKAATTEADALIGRVMSARGYPEGEFDRRLEDLSVDHAEAVQNYRAAHEVALRHARGEAGTEDMRQAMIGYRTLFDDLVGEAPETRRLAS
ncbi:MAG: hypothetical protein JO127_14755 [Caulobacteraceae bacterium]|nr:hypothetical protein [Caulobacteraceae bacterium]